MYRGKSDVSRYTNKIEIFGNYFILLFYILSHVGQVGPWLLILKVTRMHQLIFLYLKETS